MTEHHARTRTRQNTPPRAQNRPTIVQNGPTGTRVQAGGNGRQNGTQGPQGGRPRPERRPAPAPLTLDARIRLALGHAESAPVRTGDRWPTHRANRARRRGRNGKTR